MTQDHPSVAPAPDARPRIGVLALQGDVREHVHALEAVGARAVPVRRERELAEVDGLVIPGGESTVIDKLLRAFDLDGPVRDRLRGGMPAYGSCAGMILLADRVLDGTSDQQTLGGMDVVVRRNAFGRQVDSFESDLTIDGIEDSAHDPLHAVFIRAPWVETVGPRAQVLGRVEAGPGAGRIVAVRQGPLLATSFHPEVTGDTRVHRLFVQIVGESR
ncbi:pyridoxal 5'-phosphate synthase glutaminase subunit PdxT [Cellulomonas endophytica]|uniref:pyridoxal 5'-phosphate synthase glutaminase subunit PdxT n=1 Tax=Cellulomonas endophytica TaxID=2494735 RepID=UPI0010129AC9|nr:pyridoxal 5'-phosphate synthase glutaminase subunit PdxT [Cellulomonas endophytica]